MNRTFIFLLVTLICGGCFNTKPQQTVIPQKEEIISVYDVNSLKTTDITYKIPDKTKIPVYQDGDKKTVLFNEDWFVVHKDLLKTMNENQDLLISTLKKNKNGIYIPRLAGIILIVVATLMLLYSIFLRFRG